jgi:hypothetical protein
MALFACGPDGTCGMEFIGFYYRYIPAEIFQE